MAFVEALAKAFEERGEEAIRVVVVERPASFSKLLPRSCRKNSKLQTIGCCILQTRTWMSLSNTPGHSSPDALLLQSLTAETSRRLSENRLAYYQPYDKIEFHTRAQRIVSGHSWPVTSLGKPLPVALRWQCTRLVATRHGGPVVGLRSRLSAGRAAQPAVATTRSVASRVPPAMPAVQESAIGGRPRRRSVSRRPATSIG
jgi:hypothetical protein